VYVGQHSPPADMRYEKGGCSRRLSPRKMEVLALLSEGLRTREISSRLQISGNTVWAHVKSVCDKLQVHNRIQTLSEAFRRGMYR